MPTNFANLAPGVYVDEISSGLAPIAGVGTSTAGFIGVVSLKVAKSAKSAEGAEDATVSSTLAKKGQLISGEDLYSVVSKDQKKATEEVELSTSVKSGEVKLCTNFTEF